MSEKSVLFYNDSEVFGGHEIMTVRIIRSLHERGYRVHCLYHVAAFQEHLPEGVTATRLPFHTKTRSFTMPTGGWQVSHVRQLMEAARPDLVVVAQGYAESGVRGLLASRRAGLPTVSYIPFGNNNTELNNRFALPRDWVCKAIYRLPDAYITISPHQARLLARFTRGDQPIHVIVNPADFDFAPPAKAVSFPADGPLEIAVVGRIVFKQKNQGVLVPLLRALEGQRPCRIHVIGDGPDRPRLEGEIRAAGLENRILVHGWMTKPELVPFLSERIDLLLIPSIYEGLPLILLETLHLNKPFLISDMGLLEDYDVPAAWRFDPRDPAQIARRLLDLGHSFDAEAHRRLRDQVMAIHGVERFHADVASVFAQLDSAFRNRHQRS